MKSISGMAVEIMQKYVNGQQIISVPDCLIAATSILTGYPLLTYNKKDFDFIEESAPKSWTNAPKGYNLNNRGC